MEPTAGRGGRKTPRVRYHGAMHTVVIIGGGNMGAAIARGVASRGIARVIVVEPDAAKREGLRRDHPTVEVESAASAGLARGGPAAAVVLAVKPQIFERVAEEVNRSGMLGDRLVVSIMAGVTTDRLRSVLGGGGTVRIVRAMPNLPLAYGVGATAICKGPGATAEDLQRAANLFSGDESRTLELDESLMDAFTAVAGSGPAYVFLLAEAMERGAAAVGFTREQAAWMVRQTLIGAVRMLATHASDGSDAASPEVLRQRVASKGGTTEAALAVLESRGVSAAIEAAIVRARDRGRELNGGAERDAAKS